MEREFNEEIWLWSQNRVYFIVALDLNRLSLMNTLSTSPEISNKVSALMDALATACAELVDTFVMTFDKVSAYGIKTVQGVFVGVKSLFVDVIVMKLNQVATLIKELKSEWRAQWFQPAYIDSLIELQRSQMIIKMDRHNFFKENFERRISEIFA